MPIRAWPMRVLVKDCSTEKREPATTLPIPDCQAAAIDPATIPPVVNPNNGITMTPDMAATIMSGNIVLSKKTIKTHSVKIRSK